MAHVGKVYPYAFRRDLMVWRDYPLLWPKFMRWDGDTIIANGHNDISRVGITSPEAVPFTNSRGMQWTFTFLVSTPPNYTMKVSFQYVNAGRNLDVLIEYDDDDHNHADCLFADWLTISGAPGGPTLTWNIASPPPAWVNTGVANVHWLFPGGNDFWQVSPKLW